MVRGFVYSFLGVCLFLIGSIIVLSVREMGQDASDRLSGLLLLACFFIIGPVSFAIGYWHHIRLTPGEPHWDSELGE